jgi:hypothetical protein
MKNLKYLLAVLSFIACFNVLVLGQSEDKGLASVNGLGSSVRFDVTGPHDGSTLTVIGPDGQVFTKAFKGSQPAEFRLNEAKGERLADGTYFYELRVTPIFSSDLKDQLTAARAKGNEAEVQRDLRKRGALPTQPTVQSGSFMILNGQIIVGGLEEGGKPGRSSASVPAAVAPVPVSRVKYRVRSHHPSFMVFDQVIPDDLIVQGSICAGIDCVNNEDFGFDTIRLKENNTRIQFDDTSNTAGFPTNNWQIRANSSASGGANFLAFVDQGANGFSETGTIVFEVDAGAPANSLKVASNGKVGFRTATPVLDLHTNTTDTPAIRLEQNNSGGFSAQTWDIAGNEASFFIRDVTGGSRLPFRIRPGAPSSSIDISATGDVGIGSASPLADLHLNSPSQGINTVGQFLITDSADTNRQLRLGYDSSLESGWIQASKINTAFEPLLLNAAGGNVGIGTNAPTALLSVNGTANKPGGGSWAVFSDDRLKRIRGNFNTGLKAVMQLQPVRYEYNANNGAGVKLEGEHVGFGAQAVQQVIPEAVTTNSNGFLMVNNDPILWTMLNAIKEQQKEIEALKKEIKQLRRTTARRRR